MKHLVVVAFVVATLPLLAQTPAQDPPPEPTFRGGVDVITVDVSAVDGEGRPVADLLAPDFVVRIDGVPRRIVSVEQVRVDVEAAKRQQSTDSFESYFSTNLTPNSGRLIVIAVDQLNIRPGNVRQLLAAAARFVDNLSPADRIAFVAYPEPGPSIDFTTDRARIRRAMETVVGSQTSYYSKFNIGVYEAIQVTLRNDDLTRARVVLRECRRMRGAVLDECEREVVSDMALMVNRVREDRVESLRGLQTLLAGLRRVDGQKSLIIVSEGLILDSPSDLEDTVRMAALARASVNVLIMDVQRGSDLSTAVMPPTMSEDRDLQTNGLRELASASRGALFNVYGSGDNIFDRLASELSAYYLIGVEEEPGDRNDKSHRIDVEVRRRGVTLRSRRAFVLSSPADTTPSQRLSDVLNSPFGVAEVPLRMTTFVMHDADSGKVRLLLAADVGQAGSPPGDYTVGWALFDGTGKVALSGGEKRMLSRAPGQTNTPLEFSRSLLVDPGTYSLRFGVIDESGRRGGVVRDVNAWKMSGEEFAVGDLLVGTPPGSGQFVIASVEPRVENDVAALLELYSTTPASFDRTTVEFEIADAEDAPTLLAVGGDIRAGVEPTSRAVQAVIGARTLPPGRYIVRARITRDGTPVGLLARPFVLAASPERAAGAIASATPLWSLPVQPFDRTAPLAAPLVSELLDAVAGRSPGLQDAMAEARAGRYGAASLEALVAGDQEAAGFLKGLDFYAKGDLDQAANQLHAAAGARREFFPAAFFLGATFAAAGRDRDAAGVWQMGFGTEPRPSVAYALFADARFRENQPQSVVDVLQPVWESAPTDDEIGKRLGSAFVLTGRYDEAVAVFDPYLKRNPGDQDALFAAIVAQYEAASRAGVSLSDVVRARLTRWARAYRGAQQPLVEKYLEALSVR